MTALRTLYPPTEPYLTGMLDVGDGHSIYYERVGTRGGKPAVFFCSKRYLSILFAVMTP